ncbi:MAG: hypothetical protein EOO28_25280 [Comamonadaceae bacterium]|nr:MAG: hypothetical protein EOO28_25280 [Comamonadaceae bacterium]
MNIDIYMCAMQLTRTGKLLPSLPRFLLDGDLAGAAKAAREGFETCTDSLTRARLLHAQADFQLMLGDPETAETLYAQSLSLLAGEECMGAMSCRANGLQMIARGRLETAVSCFMKNMGAQDDGLRFEAMVLLALIFREAGLLGLAQWFVEHLASDEQIAQHPQWCEIGRLLEADVSVYFRLIGSPRLADHVFWHALRAAPGSATGSVAGASRRFTAAGGSTAPARNQSAAVKALLAERHQHLARLLELARPGDEPAIDNLREQMLRQPYLPGRCQPDAIRQEAALAALAGGHPGAAAGFMAAITPGSNHASGMDTPLAGITPQGQVGYIYCTAKIMMEQGSISQGLALYRNYLKVALRTIRGLSATLREIHEGRPWTVGQKDTPPAASAGGLPPRYQLAYDYLMTQSHREDLSVHEVAASIGVTERALQLRFKSSLGCSPRDLIRQARNSGPARPGVAPHAAQSAFG